MALSEKSGVVSLADIVDSTEKTSANSLVEIKTESTYEVAVTAREIDKSDPRGWSTKKKFLVALGPILTAFVACASISLYIASIPGIIYEWHIDTTLAISPISFAALGFFLGPIIAVSSSELYGRRCVYYLSLPLGVIFTIVAGTAQNFTTLAVARTLASFAISPCVTIAAGVLNDLWDVRTDKTGTVVMIIFASSIVWAASVGPLVSASIVATTGDWRWTFYLTTILLGVCFPTLLIPETFAPELARRRDIQQGQTPPKRGSTLKLLRIAGGRTLHMIAVEPIVFYSSLMGAVYQAVLYCLYIAFPIVFQTVYGFTTYQVGLTFLPLLIGNVLGLGVIIFFDRVKYRPALVEAEKRGTTILPEERLWPGLFGSVVMPASLFWLAWTARSGIHWIVPVLSCVPLGMSILCILLSFPIYKNDVYGAALGNSALGAENIMRYGASMAIPLFTVQLVEAIGFDWTCSLLAFVALVLGPVPWVFFKFGPGMRAKSRYVPHVAVDATAIKRTSSRTDKETV